MTDVQHRVQHTIHLVLYEEETTFDHIVIMFHHQQSGKGNHEHMNYQTDKKLKSNQTDCLHGWI